MSDFNVLRLLGIYERVCLRCACMVFRILGSGQRWEGTRVPSVGPPLVPSYPFTPLSDQTVLSATSMNIISWAWKKGGGIRWRLSDHVVLEASEESGRHEVERGSRDVVSSAHLPLLQKNSWCRSNLYVWLAHGDTFYSLILMWAVADRSGQIVPLSTTYFPSTLTHARTSSSGQLPGSSDLIYGHCEQHRKKTRECFIVSNNSHMTSSRFWWAFPFRYLFILRRLETLRCRSRLS